MFCSQPINAVERKREAMDSHGRVSCMLCVCARGRCQDGVPRLQGKT